MNPASQTLLIRSPVKSPLAPQAWWPHWPRAHFSRNCVSFLVRIIPLQSPQGHDQAPPHSFWLQSPIKGSCWARGHAGLGQLTCASNESSPAWKVHRDLEPPVSAAIRAWNWKIQDDSTSENSLFTKTQAILRNHLEIHACRTFPWSQKHVWGTKEIILLDSFIPGCK